MSWDRPLQLNLAPPIQGVQAIPFMGPSSREDINGFREAIDAQLDLYGDDIHRAIFDMAGIHPHINAAGRILDLACQYHETREFSIEVRIPARIYEVLRIIEPGKMPKPAGKEPVQVRGVSVVVLNETTGPEPGQLERHFATSPAQFGEPVNLVRCEGRITDVNESSITVSLDTEEGEIIAELHRAQFPKVHLQPGMVFEYRATVTEPGTTNIYLDLIPPQHATDEELEKEENAIRRELPGLEKLDV
jgi:hypothetical protein